MSANSQPSIFDNLDQQVKEAISQAQAGNWTRLGHPSEWDKLTRLHTEQRSDALPTVASNVVQLVYLHALAMTVRGSGQPDSMDSIWQAAELIEKMMGSHYVDNDKIALLSKLAQLRAMLGHTGEAVHVANKMLALAKAGRNRYFIACAALVQAEVGRANKHQLAALKEALKQLLAMKKARGLAPDEFLLLLCTHNRLFHHYRGQGKMFRARRQGQQVNNLLAMFDNRGTRLGGVARAVLEQRFSPVLLPYPLFQPYGLTR